ncbi:MAG: transposase [Nitrosomonas sp.]
MLLTGIWHGGLSDESVGDMANTNLHVMRFLGLSLEDDVPDHSALSRFRTRLTQAHAWDGLLEKINQRIQEHDIMVTLRAVMSTPVSRTARVDQKPGHRMKRLLTGKIVTMKKRRKQPCALLKSDSARCRYRSTLG